MGVSLNYFYCCGKLKTISFNVEKKNNKVCKKKSGKKCCQNKTITVKLKTDQKTTPSFNAKLNAPLSDAIVFHTISFSSNIVSKEIDNFSLYSNPPPQNFLSKNILYCVFRI